jgi:Lysine/ornithine N-monooxygenase
VKLKSGTGWKACHNEEKNVYGAEIVFRGSWDLYEISAAVFDSLTKGMNSSDAEALIATGRRLYAHINDEYNPPTDIVFDDDYKVYCQWMAEHEPSGTRWSEEMTDAAVELFESEKDNREQRRKKREQRKK